MPENAGPTRCVLGLDGGGSHTVCVVIDAECHELGRGEGGPSNHQSVGVETARANLAEAIATARHAAGEPPLAAACWGMAGLDREEDRRILTGLAEALLPGVPVRIVHDSENALVGGTGGRREGVVIIAGTGSSIVGYTADGRTARVGGWGHLLGDEGSGYDLARRGLNAATRAHDGRGPATILVHHLPAAADVDTLEALADRIYLEAWSAPQVSVLAPVVLVAAEQGDAVAQAIVDAAAVELGQGAGVVALELGFESRVFEVVLSGGLFQGSVRLAGGVRQVVTGLAPQADVHLPRLDPALGAAWLALEAG